MKKDVVWRADSYLYVVKDRTDTMLKQQGSGSFADDRQLAGRDDRSEWSGSFDCLYEHIKRLAAILSASDYMGFIYCFSLPPFALSSITVWLLPPWGMVDLANLENQGFECGLSGLLILCGESQFPPQLSQQGLSPVGARP